MAKKINEIMEEAGLCDIRYGIKGMYIWLPYGMEIRNRVDALIRGEMERTAHGEVSFPLLIPENYFKKEEEHIKGFSSQVYWVTHGGDKRLNRKLLLRPTSETAMYPSFALWIRSHRDLPLKIFQIVNTYRYETKQTRPLIRIREIHFFESHTAHATFEDSEDQIREDEEIMNRIAKKLCIPFLTNRRPEWDKFAGAYYSIGADAYMPEGKTLQIGTFHNYRDNFSKAYGIKFKDEKGGEHYAHQTTYGMSERLIGAVVLLHSDATGLMLPPAIAPVKGVVIPVIFKGKEKEVIDFADKVYDELKEKGFIIDRRELTPGNKYYEWEKKGVPLRIEIGPRDMKEESVVIVPRDTKEKIKVRVEDVQTRVDQELEAIEERLYARAENLLKKGIVRIKDLKKRTNRKVARFNWCGDDKCGHAVEEALDMSVLGTSREKEKGKCVSCGKECDTIAYAAKTF
jgi:prolyl-tRNA synthetase